MGFRGEALASIASISRLKIKQPPGRSRARHRDCRRRRHDGAVQPCGMPCGTVIEVRNLFFNTPVRRKFLRSVPTEFGHISEQFTRVALACPRLAAVLRHNERMVYELPPTDQVLERLKLFFGSDLADRLIWVESQTDSSRLWGYVGPSRRKPIDAQGPVLVPEWPLHPGPLAATCARRGVSRTIDDGPLPSRLSFPGARARAGRRQHSSDEGRSPLPRFAESISSTPLNAPHAIPDGRPGVDRLRPRPSATDAANRPAVDPKQQLDLQLDLAALGERQPRELDAVGRTFSSTSRQSAPRLVSSVARTGRSGDVAVLNVHDAPLRPANFRSSLRRTGLWSPRFRTNSDPSPSACARANGSQARQIMQVHDCYLVVETDEGITVIDQHALHERVMYEHLRARVIEGAVESQRTLVPQPLEFGSREATALLENTDVLGQLGYGIEEFGGQTLLLTAYPCDARPCRSWANSRGFCRAARIGGTEAFPARYIGQPAAFDGLQGGRQSGPTPQTRGNGESFGSTPSYRRCPSLSARTAHGSRLDPHRVGPPIRQARIAFHV